VQSAFSYDAATIASLESALSIDRFSSYLTAADGDRRRAIALYEWNSRVSAAFYVPLQAVEVGLRNACHRELCKLFGPTWYDEQAFLELDRGFEQRIREAKARLTRFGLSVDPPHIVAELSFGFWTTLLGRRLEHPLWIRGLRRAFPRVRLVSGISPSRSVVADRFGFLREFRNRIAHHEPIFSRALEADHHSLLEVAGWMFPDLGEWTATISPCIALLSAGPSKLESS